jgi:hypothetical protein
MKQYVGTVIYKKDGIIHSVGLPNIACVDAGFFPAIGTSGLILNLSSNKAGIVCIKHRATAIVCIKHGPLVTERKELLGNNGKWLQITSKFRTSINNLSLFEKFQLGYLILMFIFFILPIVLFKMGNINLFFELIYGMEEEHAEVHVLLSQSIQLTYDEAVPIDFLIDKSEKLRNSGVLSIVKQKKLAIDENSRTAILENLYDYASAWNALANCYTNGNHMKAALLSDATKHLKHLCAEANLSDIQTRQVVSIFYYFYKEQIMFGYNVHRLPSTDQTISLNNTLNGFGNKKGFFGPTWKLTNGELLDDFLKKIKSDDHEKQKLEFLYKVARNYVSTCKKNPVYPQVTSDTPIITPIVQESLSLHSLFENLNNSATGSTPTTTTTTAQVPLTTARPAATTAIYNDFGTPATGSTPMAPTATPATATTAHIQKEAVVSNIDTSSTSANANGNEPRRSLLVGRRSPEPLSDHTKKNFGGIGEHYNNFRNSPYFYHITIGTLVSTVAIGIVIYKYMN